MYICNHSSYSFNGNKEPSSVVVATYDLAFLPVGQGQSQGQGYGQGLLGSRVKVRDGVSYVWSRLRVRFRK
jgi:hypothetical protein